MISNDTKWYQMIPNDSKWFKMIPNNFKWFQMIPNDSKWSQMISNDLMTFIVYSLITLEKNHFKQVQSVEYYNIMSIDALTNK